MSTLSDLVYAQGLSSEADVEWLHRLAGDGQLLADLAFADIVIWAPTADDSFIAVAHTRPSSAATLFYRDIVGDRVRPQWRTQVRDAFTTVRIVDSASPDWFEETPTRVRAVPIVRDHAQQGEEPRVIGVLTRHTNLGETRTPSRQQITFNDCADDLFGMIATGDFPDLSAPTGPRRGAPRASDGLIRLDVDGITTFASPNALSAFNRLGFDDELEGESLVEVVTRILPEKRQFDESLPVVVTGRAPWRTDIEARGVTVSLRTIPLRDHGTRIGAIVLCRDVTELRWRDRELMTKDATIREIHHRVKNNLQTVAALLRLQARRLQVPEGREALEEAVRRVGSIAIVHETLSHAPEEFVDFDEIADRVIAMAGEVSAPEADVTPRRLGAFGVLPSLIATPLAMALTELLQNALQHGRPKRLQVVVESEPGRLDVVVWDDGRGLPEGFDLDSSTSLGLQIVRTLVEGELSGKLAISPRDGGGTEAALSIPLPAG